MTVVPLVEHMGKDTHGCHWRSTILLYVCRDADVATAAVAAATTVVTCSPRLNQLQLPYLLCGFWPKDLPSLRVPDAFRCATATRTQPLAMYYPRGVQHAAASVGHGSARPGPSPCRPR